MRPWSSVSRHGGLPNPNEWLEPTGFEEGTQGKELESIMRKLEMNPETVGRGRTVLAFPRVVEKTQLHHEWSAEGAAAQHAPARAGLLRLGTLRTPQVDRCLLGRHDPSSTL